MLQVYIYDYTALWGACARRPYREWLIVGNLLEEALINRAEISVVSRERLAKAVCEMELGRSDLVDKATAAKLGKLIGANVQVEGTIHDIRVRNYTSKDHGVETLTVTVYLGIRFVSVETGELLVSMRLEGEEKNISTSVGRMDDSAMVPAAIRNAIDNYKNINELKAKLTHRTQS